MGKYDFSWDLLGNLDIGRPNLGASVDLSVYRLMQFTLRDVLEKRFGADEADRVFYEAGRLAGSEFYRHFISPVATLEDFVGKTQHILKSKKIGILRIEEVDLEKGIVVLTVDEDLDCSGMPERDDEICVYDEGFISALFVCFTHTEWGAKETDCWCTGARTCRFKVFRLEQNA